MKHGMTLGWRRTLAAVGVAAFLGGMLEEACAETVYPQKTIRFPGSGVDAFAADGTTLVAGSCWMREDGVLVFDISEPSNIVFKAGVKGCGYVTAPPVIVPGTGFAIVPNWHSASVIDCSDKANPRIVQNLAFDTKRCSVREVRLLGRYLFLQGDDTCRVYTWNAAKKRAEFVESFAQPLHAFPRTAAPDPRARQLPPKLRERARVIGDHAFVVDADRGSVRSFHLTGGGPKEACERFFLYGLGSLAVKGERAYVYAPTFPTEHVLMTLDLRKSGTVDFEPSAIVSPKNRKGECFRMGMLPSGVVETLGDRLLTDDGWAELTLEGLPVNRKFRTDSVTQTCVDGTRAAHAFTDRVEVREMTSAGPKLVSSCAFTNLLHVTGVALEGDILWAVAVPKPAPHGSFLDWPPPTEAHLYGLDVSKREARILSRTVLPSAVSCVLARRGLLVVPGIASKAGPARLAVVDVTDAAKPQVLACAEKLVEASSYRAKRFGDDVYFNDGGTVKKLDLTDPTAPKAARVYTSNRDDVYGVDDFAIADGRLCALSHGSLAVYGLKGEGSVPPSADADRPIWSPTPSKDVKFVYSCHAGTRDACPYHEEAPTDKTLLNAGRVARPARPLAAENGCLILPEGEAMASVVAKDGTVYVAAGVSVLAVVRPDGRVSYVRHKGPRWHYLYAYGKGVALSPDEKTVYVDSGEGEGGFLAYSTDALRQL